MNDLTGSVRVVVVAKADASISRIAEKMISCRAAPSFAGVRIVLGTIRTGNIEALATDVATLAVLKDRELQFLNSIFPPDPQENLLAALKDKPTLKPSTGEISEGGSKSSGNATMRDLVKITNATSVWTDYNVTGEGVTLAVVDSGVDYGALTFGYWDAVARDKSGYPAAFDADAMCLVYTDNPLVAFDNGSGVFINTSGLDPQVYFPILVQYGYLPVIPFSELFGGPFPSNMDVTGIVGPGKTCHWGVMFQWLYGLDLFPVIIIDSDQNAVCDNVYADMSFDRCWIPYWYNRTFHETWPFWSASWPPDFSFTDEAAINVTSPIGARDFTGDGIYDLSISSLGYFLDAWGMSPNLADRGLVLQPIDPRGNYACFVYDFYGHGTSCASCAAGRDLGHPLFGGGMAYNAKIMGITALFIGDLIEGELWAAGFDLIPETGGWIPVPGYGTVYGVWNYTGNHKADIISNSWGWSEWALASYTYGTPWYDVLTALEDVLTVPAFLDPDYPGTVVVHAGGNGGPGYGTFTEPAFSTLAIGVGASTSMNWTRYEFGFAGGYYDDVMSWSARGPTALGTAKPDILGVGAYAIAATAVFQGIGDGTSAFWVFGGTSLATPIVAGAAALVREGFKKSSDSSPTPEDIKLILKSTAVDLGYDAFAQGAGRVDCYKAVSLAMKSHGISVGSSATWDNVYNMTWTQWLINYDLLESQLKPSAPSSPIYDTNWFAGIARPSETLTTQFTIRNPSAKDVSVNISPFVHRQIGQTTILDGQTAPMPSDWASAPPQWNWGNITFIDKATIPPEAELMTVSLVVPYEYFDAHMNYTWSQRCGVMIQDWDDTNHDDVVNVNEVWQINYGFNTGTSNKALVGFPTMKFKHSPIVFVYQRNGTGVPLSSIPFKIFIRFYNRVPWSWVTLSPTNLIVHAGSSEIFNATLSVPSIASEGIYEGQIIANATGNYSASIAIPVSACVPAIIPQGDLTYNIAHPEAGGLYDSSRVEGYFDWSWRYEAGDWRNCFLELTDPSTVAAFVYADWSGTRTDIDMFSIHPIGVFVDGTGEYWIQDGIFSWHTRTNSTEEYVMLYPGPIPGITMHLPNIHTVLMHNVLFDGTAFPENVSYNVRVINVEPALPLEITLPPSKSKSQRFNLTTGIRLTNVSLSTIPPFQMEFEPNFAAEISSNSSWSFEVTVRVPSDIRPGTYWTYMFLGANELPQGSTIPLPVSINVPAIEVVDLKLDVGKVHFPGELAQLYILTASNGASINMTGFTNTTLWYRTVDGTYLNVKLDEKLEQIDLGLQGVPFTVPVDASSCVLVATVEKYVEETNTLYKSTSMTSFDVSSVLSNWKAWLENIVGDVAVIKTDVGTVRVNMTTLNATLVNLVVSSKGEVIAEIDTSLGNVETALDSIDARLTGLNNTEAEISTLVGIVKTNVSAINLKVDSILGDVALIKTDLGDLNGTIVSIQDDVATIQTNIGTVKIDIENVPSIAYGIWVAVVFSLFSLVAGTCAVMLLTRKRKPGAISEVN